MANLLGSSIEPNYRGILNLGDTINQPLSGTLQSITDGMGNASPLSLSTTIVGIGRTGVDGLVNWRRSSDGNGVAAMGVRPGFSDWYFEGNNVNFRTNSTGFFFGGGSTWVTPTARLHVRGDGTNPTARFENDLEGELFRVAKNGGIQGGTASIWVPSLVTTFASGPVKFGVQTALDSWIMEGGTTATSVLNLQTYGNSYSATSGVRSLLNISNTGFAASAGSANFRPISIDYTINNSGAQTGTSSAIYVRVSPINPNGMALNFIECVDSATVRFRADRLGNLFVQNSISAQQVQYGTLYNSATGFTITSTAQTNATLTNIAQNDFSLLRWGGNTNLYPAIKRNGAGFQIRLADDTDFSNLGLNIIQSGGDRALIQPYSSTTGRHSILNGFSLEDDRQVIQFGFNENYTNDISSGAFYNMILGRRGLLVRDTLGTTIRPNSSAVLEITSIERGFLPPRMTTTQKNAITSPAAGLVVYDTTLNKLCVFTTVWETITST